MSQSSAEESPHDVDFGPVRVLFGKRQGRYPDGNSILVRGAQQTILIDPAVGLHSRETPLPHIDQIILSHCHEDHIAGLPLFPKAPVHVHEFDRPGLDNFESMCAIYGYPPSIMDLFANVIKESFHYETRPDALSFQDNDVFELGEGVTIRVIHSPGHTRGHSCFSIEWLEDNFKRSFLYLGDIELTSFGPYYGDAWSNLEDFEHTLAHVRTLKADWYGTFHHIGVLDNQADFLDRMDRFTHVILKREQALLDFLTVARSFQEVREHRFVFRPHDTSPHIEAVEARSMQMHIDRLIKQGRVERDQTGRLIAL